MRIFGREPALWITLVGGALTLLASFHTPGVPAGLADAVIAFLTALLVAVTTRPWAPALFKGVVTAAVAVLAEYGFHFSDVQIGSVTAFAMGLTALLVRSQVSPAPTLVSNA